MTSEANVKQYRLLVVDDTPDNIDLLRRFLRRFKQFSLLSATSGRAAIEVVQTESVDLILLDVMMPDLDGFATYEALKTLGFQGDIPTIFMSGLSDLTSKLRALESGAVDYITKPFQEEEVYARIQVHLRLLALKRELQAQNQQLQREITERRQAELALAESLDRERQQREVLTNQYAALQQTQAELQNANRKLKRLTRLDGLTQVANRRAFDEGLAREWRRLAREQQPIALILCDVDYFKGFNDSYGHQLGDDCLIQVAQTLAQITRRPADLVARYGGEEFALILPDTDESGAIDVAKRLLTAVISLAIPNQASQVSAYVTVSVGLCSTVPPIIPTSSPTRHDLVAATDAALYAAKQGGRNRFCLHPITSTPAVPSLREASIEGTGNTP